MDTIEDYSQVSKIVFTRVLFMNTIFLCHRLGQRINNEDSVLYWAAKNNIPVFSPAITDGAFGDALYGHSKLNPGLVVDLMGDLRRIDGMAEKVSTI